MIRINTRQSGYLVAALLGAFVLVASISLMGRENQLPSTTKVNSSHTSGDISSTESHSSASVQAQQEVNEDTKAGIANTIADSLAAFGIKVSVDGPVVEIKDFKRSESKDGKLAWELAGLLASYQVGGNQIAITDAKLSTRVKNGEVGTLTTPLAVVFMDGSTLNEAKAKGTKQQPVTISLESGLSLTTSEAAFDRMSGNVKAIDGITIADARGSLTADTMNGQTNTGVFVFTGNVHTTILPSEKK